MTNAVANIAIQDIEKMANVMAKSGLFGMKSPEQAFALMLLCQGEGIHPAIAVRDFHIIQGRPALKADAMLARFQTAGGKVNWVSYTDDEVTGKFSHPQGGEVSISWTISMARNAGLAGKDNWKNFPRAMLRARCISEGIRTVFPGCVVGTYTPEEVQDFDTPHKQPVQRDMGPVEVVIEANNQEGALPLFVPGAEEAYGAYSNKGEWLEAYLNMVGKICGSQKLNSLTKREKVQALWEINREYLDSLSAIEKARLRSAIVELGGTAEVKPDAAPEEPTETV
jgi:hypothetical protein